MLSEQDVRKYISDLGKAWELKDGKIVKSFHFPSFMDAIEFVIEVARIAEELTIIQLLQLTGRQSNFL